jgi:2-dehydro-3-deoxyphosphogluconate aldolase/(4S)-4-hydroxy-2-oxoglutarate aldolase
MSASPRPRNGADQVVLQALERARVVPLVTLADANAASPLREALAAAGLPLAEVAFRTPAAGEALRRLASDPALLVGAGTVITADQAEFAAGAGARFIVSPGFSPAVVYRSRELGLLAIPGIATATELQAACEAGLRLVKFFPAEPMGGTRTLHALAAAYPHVRFLPSGGITAANLASYLRRPEVLAVSGSWIVPEQAVHTGDFTTVTRLATQARTIASLTPGLPRGNPRTRALQQPDGAPSSAPGPLAKGEQ